MTGPEQKVDEAIRHIKELSDPAEAIPIDQKQSRTNRHLQEIALGLSYTAGGINYPAIHNTHLTAEQLANWALTARTIRGDLEPESLALSTFLNSLGQVKQEGPKIPSNPIQAAQAIAQLFERINTTDDKLFEESWESTSYSFARLWSTGQPDQFHKAVGVFIDEPYIAIRGTPELPPARRKRISALRLVLAAFDDAAGAPR
jgi:hypothetical protein